MSSLSPTLGPALGLDETVFPLRERLRAAGVPDPRVFFLMATGVGFLPARLRGASALELGELISDCEPWNAQVLCSGTLAGVPVWALEDVSAEPLEHEPAAPWMRALPLWLAAASGAVLCVHTSAGSALPSAQGGRGSAPVRGFSFARDHINLSGATPLLGLGESKLGPLFPDLTRLHHVGLRRAALARAEALGIPAVESVVACTLGPALETPAERTMLARLGADVAVPALATPLLAAGHAGLALLAIVAVTDATDGGAEVRRVVEAAAALQPALEDLLLALAPDLAAAAETLAAGERT